MSPWLELPFAVAAAVVAGSTILLWPTFSQRRPGADWVERVQRGPLRGCGAALIGALVAQLALTLPLTTWLARGLGAPDAALAHVLLTPPAAAVLSTDAPQLTIPCPTDRPLRELQLRPVAALPAAPLEPSRLQVRVDGTALPAELAFDQSGQLGRVAFEPRRVENIEIVLLAGNVPLFFADDSVTAVEHAERSGTANGCICAVVWLLPTFVAAAFGCLCGAVASTPTVLTVTFGLLFLLTVAGIGPGHPALLALLRGHWLPSAGIFTASASSLVAGSAAMIGAMLLRRRTRP